MAKKQHKITKRGFVMTGGGAKGLYEAGVIHAFHLCGMEFDVITGSSIGAINSVFYAEYQHCKKQLPPEIRDACDPLLAIEAMDPLVRAFLHVWWRLPEFHIIDDSEEGPLGEVKEDLLDFNISLPQVASLAWWWTDPERGVATTFDVSSQLLNAFFEVVERLGSAGHIVQGLVEGFFKKRPFRDTLLRTYLSNFDIENALVPDKAAEQMKLHFTTPETPLRSEHLKGKQPVESGVDPLPLMDGRRTLRDYAEAGIEVRLTRTNYRTGRLEVSSYVSQRQFIRYLRNHAWRWQRAGKRAVSLGSERLYVLGNPRAMDSALASGRFPGVFAPMPIDTIYDLEDENEQENQMLVRLLNNWLFDDDLKKALLKAYDGEDDLENRFQSWRCSENLYDLFPHENDIYIDGGTIDNTPTNNAIDAVKDWATDNKFSLKDVYLDLYTVFLHPSPDPGVVEVAELPASYRVVQRALEIRGEAKIASDATTVQTISTFSDRAEELGETAAALAGGLTDTLQNLAGDLDDQLSKEQRDVLLKALQARLAPWLEQAGGRKGKSAGTNLHRINKRVERQLQRSIPLRVTPVEIFPDKMPMDTLQFTERLGWRPENAIEMMTVGCYNTLWELREHLEKRSRGRGVKLDAIDQRALDLARHWTGFDDWPDQRKEPERYKELHKEWVCQRKSCVFYDDYCAHGKPRKKINAF